MSQQTIENIIIGAILATGLILVVLLVTAPARTVNIEDINRATDMCPVGLESISGKNFTCKGGLKGSLK